ncbi:MULTISPECIES: hypothetical protein [unclassified Cryobacterium]|uniref:hypothetical protein n=1 Tax=unclassified Cryobacterium TaxID=2649013 RepID=UPI00106A73BE|nr:MULTISPECIES: hypothetical protein [unclassified Cryobacterium]TFC00948.1 hypothetical protein E3O39_00545 [Cryobacterium sp. MDB2-A-1]TFC05078.1 hypothetical protein E3O59_13140 [Cryobacterium sp. MDB2-33-2]TFC13128.1 hypothetical protein E3O35_06165 [Cryobacterium sp. MDB2-A-2]TFC23938.1 hypothetical protein E3O51_00300 [Cryobacterium sp. MDB2-10]TFC30762.1 hypothetical protein E3O55_07195 [Cryobacterium sp. MDB1-18-2]
MTAGGLMIVLIAGGGLVLAVIVLASFYLLSARPRARAAARELRGSNPELSKAFAQFQADVEKGQRGL